MLKSITSLVNNIFPRVASSNLLEGIQPIDWSKKFIVEDELKLICKLILNYPAFILFLVLPWKCQSWLICCDSTFEANFEAKANSNAGWVGYMVLFFLFIFLLTAKMKRKPEEIIRQWIPEFPYLFLPISNCHFWEVFESSLNIHNKFWRRCLYGSLVVCFPS